MVESDEDLAVFFDADEFAESADYQSPVPGTDPVPCLVILDRGQGRGVFAPRGAGERESAAKTGNRKLWVQAGDGANQLADVRRDGLFTVAANGEVLKVANMPALDHVGHVWSVELIKV